MPRLLVLGAGNIGSAIAAFLCPTGDYDVTVADSHEGRLMQVPAGASRLVLDANRPDELERALGNCDIVVSACPYYLNIPIAEAARLMGVHYFDLTEDRETTRSVRRIAHNADRVFMPQCGLAPGFVSIAAADLSTGFDRLRRVRMRVGALPLFPTNTLKYNLTWSTAGLINEYCNLCEVIIDGEVREVLPLEGYEQFSLDGVTYEAFNTSGGLGTLCETLSDHVDNLDYKTIRYPGHCDLVRFLCSDLQLCKRRDLFLDVLEKAVPITAQDVVVVFVTASGEKNGRLIERTYTRKIYHGVVSGQHLAAIQISTAAAVCASVDLVYTGALPQRGFLRQEDVSLDAFIGNRFGKHFELHGRDDAFAALP